MRPEDEFKNKKVKPTLDNIHCWYFLNESFLSIRGLPDIVGVCNGRFFAWEIKHSKSEAKKTTGRIALQKFILSKIEKFGGIARVVHPDNLEECKEELLNLL